MNAIDRIRYAAVAIAAGSMLALGCGSGASDASFDDPGAAGTADDAGADGSSAGDGALIGDGASSDDASADGAPDASVAIDALSISPATVTLSPTGATPATQQFTAQATVSGGTPFAVNAQFSVDVAAPGSIDATTGLYTTSNAAGGAVTVTAKYGGKTATAEVDVVLHRDGTAGNVPPGAGGWFDPSGNTVVTDDATNAPHLVYPVPETMFPQNVDRVLIQWKSVPNRIFRLGFDSPTLHYAVYTDGVHATCTQAGTGGSCWESDATTWAWIAASNAGQAVTLTLASVDPSKPGTVWQAAPVTLRFSSAPVPGAIYYWSTTAQGTRRGTLGNASPTSFFTPNETGGKCVACHTLSRNGKRLAADVGGENLWVVDVVPATPPPTVFSSYDGKSIASSWATFSPDASRVISAKKGTLTLRDGSTGAPIGPGSGAVPLGAGHFGTQPDWAPDGGHVAFTLTTKGGDRGLSKASIAWLSVAGDTFSGLETIVASSKASDNYGYPSFNPTSDWIAVARGDAKSDSDATGQVELVRAMPNAIPVPVTRANTLVNDGTVASGIANGMPTWAPTTEGGLQWIAFTSTRDYGVVLAKGSKLGSGKKQLWIAAIDAAKLGSGDPSYPAFRVPFQELGENCHRPYWANDALAPPPDGGVGDGGTMDAAAGDGGAGDGGDAGAGDGGADAACLDYGADCTSGYCCAGLACLPDTSGDYTCGFDVH